MDFLQKIGGRKFILALIAVGVSTVIEVYTERGLSATMAGLLGSLVAAFSVANFAVTRQHMTTKGSKQDGLEMTDKMDEILKLAKSANDGEAVNQLSSLLLSIDNNVRETKVTLEVVGKAMVNINNELQRRRA